MRERQQIVQRWRHGSGTILVTLVRVQGSSYRQPGARLMIGNDGRYCGSISAGCLETDVLRKAAWNVRHGATVESYSTLLDETADMPFGLGCGGVIDILLEPVDAPECKALMQALEDALAGHEHMVATWLPAEGRVLKRAIFGAEGELRFSSEGLTGEDLAGAQAKILQGRQAELPDVFVERLAAPQKLFIFGAGEDVRPLVTCASLLGWTITVLDGRAHLARGERFPEATVELLDAQGTTAKRIQPQDAVVLMTHSYEQDRDALQQVLPQRPRYCGLLGARKRSSLLLAEVASRLDWSLRDCCELVTAPAGLDLGGEGPEAIALSIIAEIQACCMGKQADTRRLTAEFVQSCVTEGSYRLYLQNQCGLQAV